MRRRREFVGRKGRFMGLLAATSLAGSVAVFRLLGAEEIHPASGLYASAFSATLSATDSNAVIYYTTNGTTPGTDNGFRYEGPLQIGTTTILRATAFRGRSPPVEFGAQTYIFAKDVLKQTGGKNPESWGSFEGRPIASHYEMAAAIVGSPAYRSTLLEGLAAVPSLSIVTDPNNLFDAESGIYTHPTNRGSAWERPASAELLPWHDQPGFRANCGLRVHGGSSRRPEESPKHSLRLIFKKKYGPEKLRFPLFGSAGRQQFDTLILRAGNNNSWLHPDVRERRRADYIRDEWMRESMLAMGYPSARSRLVHLYLNGLYWGVYDLCERPDASFVAAEEQWVQQDYDFRKGQTILSGDRVAWDKMMSLANSDLSDNRDYSAIPQYLDVTEFADYFILNLYAGNSDWDRNSNWYAGRRRTSAGKFRFFVWDSERILEGIDTDITHHDDDESPFRLFQQLSENAAFRLLFARRVDYLLFNAGALAPGPAAERYQALARTLEKAVVAESARWGCYRRDVHPYKIGPYEQYTLEEHWRPEVGRILTEFFPRRRERVLQQLRERGLYPEAETPAGSPQRGLN